MNSSASTELAPGLFVDSGDGDLQLVGGRHRSTGRAVFPAPADLEYDQILLPIEGKLWSWTVQRFRPKTPPYLGTESFQPFAVGYVQLGEALIVQGVLVGVDFETLEIGMPMRVVPFEFQTEGNGSFAHFAFAPGETGHA